VSSWNVTVCLVNYWIGWLTSFLIVSKLSGLIIKHLSLQKCTILHLGRSNTLHNYSVNNVCLPDVTVVTDLNVMVDNNLRFTKHYRSMVNKANHRSSLILKSFQSRNPQLLFRAFTVFVHPCWAICSPVWAPVYKTYSYWSWTTSFH